DATLVSRCRDPDAPAPEFADISRVKRGYCGSRYTRKPDTPIEGVPMMRSWTERDQKLFERIRDSGPAASQADGVGADDTEITLMAGTISKAAGPASVDGSFAASSRIIVKGARVPRKVGGIDPHHDRGDR